jgi:hypothetical protein
MSVLALYVVIGAGEIIARTSGLIDAKLDRTAVDTMRRSQH